MAEKVIIEYEVKDNGALEKTRVLNKEVANSEDAGKKAAKGFSTAAKAAAVLGASLAAAGIVRFMRDSVRAAAEQQNTFTSLAASLKNVGVNYNDVGKDLQVMLGHLQATTRYGDTDTAAALQRLVAITGDYDAALKLLTPTLDFATAMNIDLATASRLAGQAATGMTGTLSRYGVVLTDATREQIANADAMERAEIMARELGKRFGGAAAADVQTYAGRILQMSNYWGDLQEALGDVIVKTQAAPGVMSGMISAFETLTGFAKDFGEVVVFIANYDFSSAAGAYTQKLTAAWLRLFAAVNRELAKLPEWMGGGQKAIDTANLEEGMAAMLDHFADAKLDQIFDDANDAANEFRDSVDNVTTAAGGPGGMIETLEDVGVTGEDVFKKIGEDAVLAVGEHGVAPKALTYMEILAKTRMESVAEQMEKAAERGKGKFDWFWEETGKDGAAWQDTMISSFSDLLGKGFTGELESFSDLWDEIWQDLAKSMTGIIGDAFEDALSDGGTAGGVFARFGDNLKSGIENNALGAIGGGLGGMFSAYQSGSVFQGLLSGGMAGAGLGSLFPGIGTLFGALIGGGAGLLGGLFGGSNSPTSSGYIGLGGGAVTGTSSQELGEGAWDLFATQRVQEYREAVMGMNDILRLFGDSSLFDLVGEAGTWNFSGRGTLESFATVFREQWLPEAMRQMFEGAINQGLGDLGVSDATIDQLWTELGGMLGSTQIQGLETYITSLIGITDLYADMDWNAILDESKMDSFSAFMAGLGDIVDGVQMQMLGIGDMTLLERAEQAQTIEQLILSARQAEVQMLRQIDQMQQSINRSIDQQIEGIRTGGMSDMQQRTYYEGQIAKIMARLRGGAGSPEEIQQLMGDLQRYVGLMQGALGGDMYQSMAPWGGDTWADWLVGVLEEARGLSNDAFEGMRDQIRETNELLIAELQLLIEALTNFGGALTGGDGKSTPLSPEVTVPVEVNVNIEGDKSLFVKEVRSIVYAEMNRNRTLPGNDSPHGVM